MTPNPDAVKAAAEAVFARIFYAAPGWEEGNADEHALAVGYAEAAVAAAEPVLRRQIAAEIRAERDRVHARYEAGLFRYVGAVEPGSRDPFDEAAMDALDTAARIAEGTE